MKNVNKRRTQKERRKKELEHQKEENENIRQAVLTEEAKKRFEIKGRETSHMEESRNGNKKIGEQKKESKNKVTLMGREEKVRRQEGTELISAFKGLVEKKIREVKEKKQIEMPDLLGVMHETIKLTVRLLEVIEDMDKVQKTLEREVKAMRSQKEEEDRIEEREERGKEKSRLREEENTKKSDRGIEKNEETWSEADKEWRDKLEELEGKIRQEKESRSVICEKWERRLKETRQECLENCRKERQEGRNENTDKKWQHLNWRVEMEERHRKRNNIIIMGMKGKSKNEIRDWIHRELKVKIEPKNWWRISGKVDMFGLELQNREEKEEIMKRKSALNGSNIYINNDLTWEERRIRITNRVRAKRRA